MRRASYDKQAVIADIAEQKISPIEIADKHGITVGNVYTIKAQARRAGIITSRGYKTIEERLKDESSVLTPELRERVKDMRERDLTTTEITAILNEEGIETTFDEVAKIMVRAAAEYAVYKPGIMCGRRRLR